jgi:hypothetical protein
MLCLFSGRPALPFQDLLARIEADVAPLEKDGSYQERKTAVYTREKDLLTGEWKAYQLRAAPQLARISPAVTRTVLEPGPPDPDGNPTVILTQVPITMDDFPDDMLWGNGLTVGARIQLKSGDVLTLSWCVHPDSQEAQVTARYDLLRSLMEG